MKKQLFSIVNVLKANLILFVLLISNYSVSQSVSSSNGTPNCAICVPAGWTQGPGTPDISNSTIGAAAGTGGGGARWINQAGGTGTLLTLPLPPNGHTNWISLRDVGSLGLEESVLTNMTGLTPTREYDLFVYSLTVCSNTAGQGGLAYAGRYIDQFGFQVGGGALNLVSPVTQNVWGTSKLRFTAAAATQQLTLRPFNNSPAAAPFNVASSLLVETVQLSVTLNAINAVPDALNDSATGVQDLPTTLNVITNDIDYDGTINVASVDLDPSTPGIQNTFTSTNGNWSVDNLGNVTFTPNPGFVGTETIPYTVNDNFVLDGVSQFSTATPANISVTVLSDNDGDGIDDTTDLDDDNDGIFDTVEDNCSTATTGSISWSTNFLPAGVKNNYQALLPETSTVVDGTNLTLSYVDPNTDINEISVVQGFGATFGQVLEIEHQVGQIGGSTTTFDFDNPVRNLTFRMVDVDYVTGNFGDRLIINAYRTDGSLVNITPAYYTTYTGAGTHVLFQGANTFEGNPTQGNAVDNDMGGVLDLVFPDVIDRIEFTYFNIDGTRAQSQRIGIANLSFLDVCDNDLDNDGIINSFDLDSDNDGCSDANEYYNSSFADGNDNLTYGVGTPTVNPNGTVTTASYTGSYTNVIDNVVSIACLIDAVDDDFTGTPVNIGDSTPTVVLNDALSGSPVVIGTNPGEVTLTGVTVPAELTLNPDGTITVNPNTPSGTYTVVYEICENGATPANCDTATATVLVENVIEANDDDFTPTPVSIGDSTPSVVANNDLLDGVTPVIGTNPGEVTLTGVTVPAELTLNPDGTITVNPNTPSGTYTVVYEICENGATPANCDTATATVLVENVIEANDDDFTPTPVSIGDSTPSVVANNDLLDGVTPVIGTNPGEVTLTGVTVPAELTLNPDGTITVNPNTPSGTYTVVYEICENGATPANCDTATATVLVENVIEANDDDFTPTPVSIGDSTPSVVANNDLLDGVTPVIGTNPGEVTLTGVTVPAELTLNPDGTITVNPNTPSGTYTVVYEICENGATPANCDTATVTVLVENVIEANDDDFTPTPVSIGDSTPSVVANNDLLDGVTPIIGTNPGEVTLTGVTVPAELTLNPDGTITVNPNTPSGTYTVVYEICENGATPANCDTATATILVQAIIDAVDDTPAPVTIGDSTPSVVLNDELNNTPVVIGTNPGEVTLTGVTVPAELTLNPDGTITVNPNTPSGTYTVVYEICENGATPANCDTATATVLVENVIEANDDDFTPTPVSIGDSTPSVVANNDLLDGVTPIIGTNPGEVTLTGVTVPAELTLNPDGTITVNPNTPSGTYTVVYEICENGATPANCDTATATVLVENVIEANDDDFTTTPVSIGDSTPSVVANNDLLDGVTPVIGTNPGEVTLTGVTVPAELTLNPDGTITVNPNTPSGTYTVVYEICENGATPANCDTATATVLVENVIEANDDDFTPTPVSIGDSTPSVVANNDLLDGVTPVIGTNPGEVTLTGVTVPAELTLNPDGTITVNPNTPSGTYTVVYEICENGATPANCDTATATILVQAIIDAVDDTPAPVTIGDSTPSVVLNDELNNTPVVIGTNPGEVTLTGVTVPAELTLNPDGTITVNPNTPSGTYTVVYEICENGATPANCDTATATILVQAIIDAVDDTPAPVTIGDSTPSVVLNDELNNTPVVIGTNPGEVTLTGVTVPAELTLNPDGTITVNPNTPSGTYTVVYEICENGATPANCDTATATVLVENVIEANDDDFTPTPVSIGDSTPSVVANNDLLDGVTPIIGTNPGEVTLTGVTVPAELTLNPDGTITVNPNTPSGTYTVVYEICENGATPANCDTATATVLVENVIEANDDDFTTTPVSIGDSTPSVVANNDLLDGVTPVIGTNPGEVTLTGVTVPAELTLNPDGTITVNPNTPSGTYTVVYEICENGATPANCDTATATVLVENVIEANDDDFTPTPVSIGDSTPSVVANNDLLDGVTPVIGTNPGEVTLTGVTVPAELTLNPDGTITVNPNTPSGTYTVVYEICENGATPANCDTATATVLVENVIEANDDDFTPTPVSIGDSTPSVVANNDLLDGVTPVIGTNPGEVTLTGVTVPAELTLNPDGTITVNPNTPSGTYTVVYEICENGATPANCDTATATILVQAIIDAVDDTPAPVTIGDSTPSVVLNDELNNTPVVIGTNPGEVTLTGVTVPAELTLNPDGTITVNPNTPSGTYTVVYEICENGATPANCDTATATVLVENVIEANDDDFTPTPVSIGDSTPSVVANNDLLDGVTPIIGTNPGEVTLTGVTVPAELTLNPDGTITVNPNTPSGTYTVVYEICENGATPANCDTATATVLVENVIEANDDDFTPTPVSIGDSTPSVVANNDLLDGVTPIIGTNPGEVTLTGVTVPAELTLNPDGTITVNPNTPSGTYTVVYEICENGATPANCDTATATVLVENVIEANDDDFTPTPVSIGDSTPSVVANNDLLDGVTPIIGTNPGEVTLTGVTVPAELTLNPDGTITVNPNTPSGTYTVVYEICENGATPANCDTATATVLVENVIEANDDDFTTTPVSIGDSTPSVVANNDLLDGVTPIIGTNPGEVTLTGVTVPAELTLNPDGTITVNPNTPSGTYTVVYEICENGATPANCDTATATVLVENVIEANDDDFTTTPVSIGDSTPSVVANNDLLDGVTPIIGTNPGEVTLTGVTVPAELTLNPDGTITVNPNTPSGTYTVVYEICENGATPANCDTATATVLVENVIEANDDDFTPTPVSIGDSTPSVVANNDLLDGVTPVIGTNPGEVTLTGVTVPAELTLNPDGTITVNPNTPSGTYTVVYEICENGATPANCDTATATVLVENVIEANDDDFTPTPVSIGDSTPSVVANNDLLDGVTPVIGTNPGEVTLTGVTVPAELTLNPDGTITVNPNTPSGAYTVVYEICENGATPANCDTATATVLVENVIEANDDDFTTTPVSIGDSTPSVVANNDLLDGVTPVIGTNPGEVTLTGVTVPAELTLNPDGTITVNPNTPSGTYTVVYEICENGATPANCDTATVTVLVENVIEANDDDFTPTPVSIGDSTPSVVANNDLLDGVTPIIGTNPGEVTLTGVTVPAELTLNPDGTITVNPNTPSGTYTVVYEICENGATPANCDTATATILVQAIIDAVDDTPAPVTIGDSTPSVVLNDELNNTPVVIGTNPGEVTLTGVTVPAELTLNPDGTITVNPNTPSGTYTVVYEICENGATPANCDTATATVLVENVIEANDDDFTPTPVSIGDSTPSVVANNDLLDGVTPVIGTNPGEVTLTGVTVPAELTLNPDGTITVNPNTPSGPYTVVYEICENGATPANCDTATATVLVENVIEANDDDFTTTPVSIGDSTPSVVANNDLLDGVTPVIGTNPGEVTLTGVTVPAELTLNPDGTITVNPNTPSGTYTVVYEICENGATPANCDTATATVLVENVIEANDDDFTPTPVSIGDSTPSVVANNDLLDGVTPVIGTNPGEVTLTGVTVPAELTLNPDGTITVNPNTPSGPYTVVYEICENGATPANCDTATATVLVENVIEANDDDFTPTPVSIGDSTPSVVANNDLLDGVTPVIGTNPGEVTLTGVTVPAELTLNPDGTITVNPNTPSGTYTVVYEICENGATPANCDTATATILVQAIIDAVDDGPESVDVNLSGTIIIGSVIANDTLDNTPVTIANIDVTPVTNGPLSIDVDGNVILADNTPAGTYSITYELCETGAIPANCDIATATFIIITDSDGDGVSNIDEIADGTDPNNNCSFLTSSITTVQSQLFLNGDCDNDGVINQVEIGNNSLNPIDTDGDGIADFLDIDDDNDGILTLDELTIDSDGDGLLNYLDQDSDGDGIPDNIEAQTTLGYIFPSGTDSNSNGLDDAYEQNGNFGISPIDTDNDGTTDNIDLDSDNDGVFDEYESGIELTGIDSDGDGLDDGVDTTIGYGDPNGIIIDTFDDLQNTDADQEVDFRDTDDDGDGILTEDENPDANGDGIPDDAFDSNGNGIPDYLEINNADITVEDDLEVFTAVSPDGDGQNDVLVIRNIQNYPDNELMIFNRWGVLVYNTTGYGQNNNYFRGISEGRETLNANEKLPVGTYFYVLKYINADGIGKQRAGYLYINE